MSVTFKTAERRDAGRRLVMMTAVELMLWGVVCCSSPRAASAPTGPPHETIVVTPDSAVLLIGDTLVLHASVLSPTGETVDTAHLAWASANPGAAIVSPAGLVTAVSAGDALVTASVGGTSRSIQISVRTASSSTDILPGDDLQSAVDAHAPGTTFYVKTGVHRLGSVTPKSGDVFIGEPGAILSGARLLTTFSHTGGYWSVAGQTEHGRAAGTCTAQRPGCRYPEELFFDNRPLVRVTSLASVATGTWFLDYATGTVYFADDPTGHVVELSVTPSAFTGAISGVTIANLTIEKYASPAQQGAIDGAASANWVVKHNEVRLNHGLGIRVGDGMRVSSNYVHHQGELGIGGGGAGIVVDANEIAYNNTAGFDPEWEAGGTKFSYTSGLIVRGNHSHHNKGPGLWTDINNINTLYEQDTVEDNDDAGIIHEISYAAVIRNNQIARNGWASPSYRTWPDGSGILVNSSSDVEISGNALTDNANGIGVIQSPRGTGIYGPYIVRNLYVHDNVVRQPTGFTGAMKDTADDSVFVGRNNRFAHDTYYLGSNPAPFHWLHAFLTAAQWRASGLDVDGVFQ